MPGRKAKPIQVVSGNAGKIPLFCSHHRVDVFLQMPAGPDKISRSKSCATWQGFCSFLCKKSIMDYKDYYDILGVSRKASQDEIKKAYRKLAAKYHPDVHKEKDGTAKRFTEIGEAYEVLKDPEKRKLYDKVGKNWKQYQQAGVDPDDAGGFGGFGGFNGGGQGGRTYQYSSQGENPFGGGFSDFFESLFGGRASGFRGQADPFSGAPGAGRQRTARGQDVTATLNITLDEAITGSSRTIRVGDEQMSVKIPAGITDGKKLKLKEKGRPGPDGVTRGDLLLKVKLLPHDRFYLQDGKLYADQPVDVSVLMLGGQIPVQTPDKQIRLTIAEGTQNGKVFRIPGMGFPEFRKPENRGPLYVKVSAAIPQNLTETQKKLISEAFQS